MRLSTEAPLILGSASPRRREILGNLRIAFVVVVADVDESVRSTESAAAYLPRVVLAKLRAIRAKLPADLATRAPGILVADTSVIVDGAIMGKPRDEQDARSMIERLSGSTHEVHTRFAIDPPGLPDRDAALHEETVVTRVTFRALLRGEAEAYAASGEGRDKAGGYAVQGLGAAFVSGIDGSYTSVVGLPACELVVALDRLGLR